MITRRKLQEMLRTRLHERCSAQWADHLEAASPALVQLLEVSHDHPMAHFYASVRQIVIEHCPAHYHNNQGQKFDTEELEQQTALICEIMEQLRREALQQGPYSDAPVPPLMFG